MGNTVCTDVRPYCSVEEIQLTKTSYAECSIVEKPMIFSPRSCHSFEQYQHNIKALCYRYHCNEAVCSSRNGDRREQATRGSSGGGGDGSVMGLRSGSASTRRRVGTPTGARRHASGSFGGSSTSSPPALHLATLPPAADVEDNDTNSCKSKLSALKLVSQNVSVEPVNLASRHGVIAAEETCVYVVIHVQRQPPAPVSSRETRDEPGKWQRAADLEHYGADAPPPWAEAMTRTFSPRGLALTFSTDIGKQRVRSNGAPGTALPSSGRSTVCTSASLPLPSTSASAYNNSRMGAGSVSDRQCQEDFRYSIHLLTGKKAHPLVAAVALLQANQLERILMDDEELQRRLFFNMHVTLVRGKLAASPCIPAPLGQLLFEAADAATVSVTSAKPPTLNELYVKNGVLRVLHRIRSAPPLPPITAQSAGSSPFIPLLPLRRSDGAAENPAAERQSSGLTSQYNLLANVAASSSRPAVGTPRGGNVGGVPSSSTNIGANAQLGFTPDIPRLSIPVKTESPHVSATPSSAAVLPSPKLNPMGNAAPGGACRTPRLHSGYSDAPPSIHAPSRGPPSLQQSLPSGVQMANLRIGEMLSKQRRQNAAGESGGLPDLEDDELRMTEERFQKLKAQAPVATEVLPWLFVGGEDAAKDRVQLLRKGITLVVNTVAFSVKNVHDDVLEYVSLFLSDSPEEPIFSLFPLVIRHIEEARVAGGRTLVHCHQGVSRSCTFVIAYVMWREGLCYDRACQLVRERRTVCSPNSGFHVNLLMWEAHLARPTLNKAFAYVPYATDFTFPFSYRLAHAIRPVAAAKGVTAARSGVRKRPDHRYGADDGSDELVVQRYAVVVTSETPTMELDDRLCYGFIVCGNAQLSSYFWKGAAAAACVAENAEAEWAAFLKYNFYSDPARSSVNNKDETVTFQPQAIGSLDTTRLTGVAEIQLRVVDPLFSPDGGGSVAAGTPRVVVGKESRWEALLGHARFRENVSAHMSQMVRVEERAPYRKRARAEELRRYLNESNDERHRSSASTPLYGRAVSETSNEVQGVRRSVVRRRDSQQSSPGRQNSPSIVIATRRTSSSSSVPLASSVPGELRLSGAGVGMSKATDGSGVCDGLRFPQFGSLSARLSPSSPQAYTSTGSVDGATDVRSGRLTLKQVVSSRRLDGAPSPRPFGEDLQERRRRGLSSPYSVTKPVIGLASQRESSTRPLADSSLSLRIQSQLERTRSIHADANSLPSQSVLTGSASPALALHTLVEERGGGEPLPQKTSSVAPSLLAEVNQAAFEKAVISSRSGNGSDTHRSVGSPRGFASSNTSRKKEAASMEYASSAYMPPTPGIAVFATIAAHRAAHQQALGQKVSADAAGVSVAASTVATVEVYEYPFTAIDDNVLAVDDLQEDMCYCILVPGNATTGRHHKVYIWLGAGCAITEDDALRAFRSNLSVVWPCDSVAGGARPLPSVTGPRAAAATAPRAGARMSNGLILMDVNPEVVVEGDEPDELILALD